MNKGFSLLEMTFVLLALSFLLSGLLSPLSARMTQSQIRQTDEQLKQAIEALIGFAILQNRLPCPDTTGDGQEDAASCDSEGDLPWADLGINGKDVWGKTLRYRAQQAFTKSPINLSATSSLQVKRKDNTALTVDDAMIALIFSRGKNQKPDAENNISNRIYTMDDFLEDKVNPNNTFDDRMVWLSKNELFYRMVSADAIYP